MSESRDDAQTKTRGTLLVVDGHSLAFRAFFALPAENFSTQAGQATNAVWGFATMLSQVLDSEKPDHLAVAFDMKGGTFRNEMLPQYKGTREAAPEDLLTQLPLIQKMLTALGVTYVEKQGYEGDDIIATLAAMGERSGYDTLVLSGDRDAFQLIDERVTVLYPGHHFKDLKHMTPQAVEDKYHVSPAQYPDLAALRGETADNIPGVPGVGDGFAAKWINQYGGLEGIIEHADEIGGKKGESLRENIEQVKLNRKVNALRRDALAALEAQLASLDAGIVRRKTLARLIPQRESELRGQEQTMNAGREELARTESREGALGEQNARLRDGLSFSSAAAAEKQRQTLAAEMNAAAAARKAAEERFEACCKEQIALEAGAKQLEAQLAGGEEIDEEAQRQQGNALAVERLSLLERQRTLHSRANTNKTALASVRNKSDELERLEREYSWLSMLSQTANSKPISR